MEIKIEIELKLNASRLTISSSSFYFLLLHKVDSVHKMDLFFKFPFPFSDTSSPMNSSFAVMAMLMLREPLTGSGLR